MATGRSTNYMGLTGVVGNFVVKADGEDTRMRQRSPKGKRSTDAMIMQQGVMRDLSNAFKQLDMASVGQWNLLGAQMMNKKATKHLTGRQAFMSVNRSRVGASLAPILEAPDSPSYPAPLPTVMQASAQIINRSGFPFTLTVTCDSAYGDMVQVFATPYAPVKGGTQTTFKSGSYKLITLLPSMSNGANALQNAYTQTFGKPEPSSTFALRFVGMSETGFKTGQRNAVALCLALSEDVAGDGDDRKTPAAPEADAGLHVA